MAGAADLDEIEEVNANCILMANLQQASTSEDQYTELLEPILEPHQVPQNDNNVISEVSCVEQSGGTVEQHPANVEETRALYDSLYNNLAIEVEKVNTIHCKLSKTNAELTTELARYKNQKNVLKSVRKNITNLKDVIKTKFVGDFKSLAKEADESLAKHKALELEIDRLLRAFVSDQKDTACGTNANTKFAKQSILGKPSKVGETHALSKPVTSNSIPIPQGSKVMKNDKVIAPGMFRINPFKPSREEKHVPNKVRASVWTKPITVSQPPVITKKVVNSDSNGLSSTGVDNTKTRRPQPRSNTKNDRVPSASKSSQSKNKEVEVEEHHRKLLLSRNKKHVSSECNNVKLATQNVKSKVVCAMCKQCLNSVNHDVCFLNYVNGMTSHGNILITRVYFVEGLGHNLFSVGQFCDSDLERYVLVIMDDYSHYTWVHFLISKDEAPEVIKTFLKRITIILQSSVIIIRTDNDTEFKNQVLKEYFDSVDISHQVSSVRTPQQNGVVKRRNRTLVEAARTMLIFSRAPLFLWAEAIATTCFTQNCSIIHRRFNKTPYELINGRKLDISFLHVFGALCYPKNDREDIGKLGTKGYIGFFIGYSADFCAYRVYNRRTKKIMETMNVTFDELSAMAFEQRSLKHGLQSMTSRQISSGLDLTYAPSTIKTQQPTEGELDLLFEAMYDDYIGGQPSTAPRTVLAAQAHQVRQTLMTSTSIADTALTPTNSSSQATNFLNTSQDTSSSSDSNDIYINSRHRIDTNKFILSSYKFSKHFTGHIKFQQGNQAPLQPETVADNVLNAMFDANMFVNPFATPSTSAAESSSSLNVEPSNMHMFYQPYPHEFQWTKDHPLEQNHFFKGTTDPTLFIRRFDDDILVVQVYVDDIIYGSKHPRYTQLFFDLMKSRFEMSMMGEMMFFLVLQVNQSPCGIFINQSNYVLEILKKYEMESCDPVGTPMEIKDKLDLDQNGTPVDATKYRSMIGALMSLTFSRPDIIHATCLCARYQAKPTEKYLKEVKRIFCYLRGTVNMGLWYTKDSGFELTGFLDADHAGCKDTFKSTSSGD
nr:hypothetical protein [Tanacetum cinerariifolium]